MEDREYYKKLVDKTECSPKNLIEFLAILYNYDDDKPSFCAVAHLCDDIIDKSGRLLGEVRDRAAKLREMEHLGAV